MRMVFVVLGVIVGAFLIARAIVELFVIDYSDASSFANDWGGPSLAGVLLVPVGPGVLAAVALLAAWRGARRRPQIAERHVYERAGPMTALMLGGR